MLSNIAPGTKTENSAVPTLPYNRTFIMGNFEVSHLGEVCVFRRRLYARSRRVSRGLVCPMPRSITNSLVRREYVPLIDIIARNKYSRGPPEKFHPSIIGETDVLRRSPFCFLAFFASDVMYVIITEIPRLLIYAYIIKKEFALLEWFVYS